MEDNSVIVSVLITLYNREGLIEETIRSVYASDFSDFELIVLDDASVDNSYECVEKLIRAEFPEIRLYRNDHNLGQFPNRNKIAQLAKGKYLKYLDSDDLLYPHSLGLMVKWMETNPEAAFGLQDSFSSNSTYYPVFLEREKIFRYNFFTNNLFLTGPTGGIIKRNVFLESGGYQGNWLVEDNLFWARICRNYPMLLLPTNLVFWRVHPAQEFTEHGKSIANFLQYKFMMEETLNYGSPFLDSSEIRQVHKSKRNWVIGKAIKAGFKFKLWSFFVIITTGLFGCKDEYFKDQFNKR
ncbi:MAG: glycosyltransferase involved in cell wall biosynthesis [Luteibaculaceae bacterium]|jgi:glycosyltransferase involved in cell wall biosynthesis